MNPRSKKLFCGGCGQLLDKEGVCKTCQSGNRKSKSGESDHPYLYCPYNDHGIVCGKRGSIGHGLTGTSQLYCPEHFWLMEGRPIEPEKNRHSGPGPAPCNHPGCTSNGVAGKNPFYCMDHYGLGSEKRRARGREPGQDDEERSA